MRSRRIRGFSLIEMMIVVALILVVTAFSVMAIRPSLRQNDVSEGFNQTLMALRQARDTAVAQRQIYVVTFNNAAMPNSITITQGSTGTVTNTYFLPADVSFFAMPGMPTSQAAFPKTPDGFGVSSPAVQKFRSRRSWRRRKERSLFLSRRLCRRREWQCQQRGRLSVSIYARNDSRAKHCAGYHFVRVLLGVCAPGASSGPEPQPLITGGNSES